MKLPLSWLNEYVDISDVTPQYLSDKLLSIGFEVEEIIYPRDDIKGVAVGYVKSIERNPNSDKLWICQIDVGTETLQIVTGAQNVKQGDKVPVAKVGAILPGGKTISPAKLRGVESFGMLCSGGELCVDDTVIDGAEVDGISILPETAVVGENIMKTLGIDDTVLDVSITANRPDCQAVVNLAKEISIVLNRKFKMPKMSYRVTAATGENELPKVKIEEPDLCSMYIGRVIKDVKIEKSPKWMRDRLRMCGIRPINNLVDITNYVLLEFGQPMHAFDRRFIDGGIIVRKGNVGEKITALDGKEYAVDDVLVIADGKKPLAIAGIMGGEYTSILPDTKDVFLESARFERSNIRRTSRKIGLRSDSSSRFEKGVDRQSVELGSTRALALFDMLGCGKITGGVSSDQTPPPDEKVIVTSKKQICALLGIEIDKKDIVSLLKKQGFAVKSAGANIICTVPLIREDIEAYPDLAEDIMRFYGYDNIVSTHLENTAQTVGGLNTHDQNYNALKNRMTALGFDEILNYSFISPDMCDKLLVPNDHSLRNEIKLKNPLGREISVMRTQLVSSMLSSISRNLSRKNEAPRFFELGKVFIADSLPLDKLPDERDVLCIGFTGGDFYELKSTVCDVLSLFGIQPEYSAASARYLHPKQSLHIDCGGITGDFGKLHPLVCENFQLPSDVYVAHIDVTNALLREVRVAKAKAISKLPPVDRDLAVIVDKSVAVGEMIAAVKASDPYIVDVKLFDIYEGEQVQEGQKSVAFSMRFQPNETTFSDAEIKSLVDGVLRLVSTKFGAKLR